MANTLNCLISGYREYIADLESGGSAVHVLAPNKDILYCNKAAEILFGYTLIECIGRNSVELLMHDRDRDVADRAWKNFDNLQAYRGVVPMKNKGKDRFMAVISNVPFLDDDDLHAYRGVICCTTRASDYRGPIYRSPWLPIQDFISLWVSRLRNKLYGSKREVDEYSGRILDYFVLEIPRLELTIHHAVDQGGYGTVYRARWHGMDVAVKVFPLYRFYDESYRSFRNEVLIMAGLWHPNLLRLRGVVYSPDDLCIVTEFLPRGSLFQLIHKKESSLVWSRKIQIALDIAEGMNYLHCCNPPIVHRNLRSSNVLVNKSWTVKVGDFGLACPKPKMHFAESQKGTPGWMSPEALCGYPCDEKMDVYSYGVVLWELVTKKIPWKGFSGEAVACKVGIQNERLEILSDLDPQWASMIERCWQRDPWCRPSFCELIQILKGLQSTASPSLQN